MNTSLAPMLSVRRGTDAIEFYKSAFGAEVLFCIDDDSGAVVAQLSIQDAVFWLADESPDNANYSPESLGGSTTRMILVVENPDAVFNRAVVAGAIIICQVQEQNGWHIGRVLDPYGHHWEIGKLS